ncbi:hypothetical protein EUX98_g5646 [Antrodiella citrinella]|uniref:NmrA-like domain-containing protein n=1 Tax=Antrodiella citrinella TaxID=2447956 RepID=A0A4S4MYQ7_9APHY|nr:hypothetical protein EUX98_g5646 [Antrodiella citrinella]
MRDSTPTIARLIMSYNFKPSIFFLGATGYLGSEFLLLLARDFPGLPVTALIRSITPERASQLQDVYPGISLVEGGLDDDVVIQEQVQKVDVVINSASSDHWPSVKSTLAGLEKSAATTPGNPPLYIHISGCGIIADNANGGPVDHVPEYSDIGLDLKKCPPTNMHLESDIPIVEAGTRKENPIRTIIIFPAQIYGLGSGIQKHTLWLRFFTDFAKKLGYVGTWGQGCNAMNNIHVKDCANAMLVVFKAALEGKAEEGAEGLYFAASNAPRLSYAEWTKVMGDHLHAQGLLRHPGTRPMPNDVVDPMGHYGWSLLGGNQFAKPARLAKLGWEATETFKHPLLEELPASVDEAWKAL